MRRVITAVLLLLLAWQAGELVLRRFVWGVNPPEVPLWACVLLLVADVAVIVVVARSWRKISTGPGASL